VLVTNSHQFVSDREFQVEKWDASIAIQTIVGVSRHPRAVAGHELKKRGWGRIINTAFGAFDGGLAVHGGIRRPSTASRGLTKTWRGSLRPSRSCNCIRPGLCLDAAGRETEIPDTMKAPT